MAKSKTAADGDVVTIKKYANRRLYDTERSCYITLDDLAIRLVDTRAFQRLRYVRQLGLAYLVYPGATHSFLEAMSVAAVARKGIADGATFVAGRLT